MTPPRLPFPAWIDNSALSSFKKCPTDWYWSNLRLLELKGGSLHLLTGGAFAAGLEAARRAFYEQGLSSEESVALGLHALILFYGDFEAPPDHVKSFPNLCFALLDYFLQYPLDSDGFTPIELSPARRAIEFTFSIPLPINNPDTGEPLLYSGRFDALGTWREALFGLDDKTATQLGSSWSKNWILDSQFTGYTWAVREFGLAPAGFLVRGLSFLKSGFGHAQAIVYRPEWQVSRWYESMLHTVRCMIAYHQEGFFPLTLDKHACNSYGGCAFHQLCESQNPEAWVASNYAPRVWNPLVKGV